MSECFHFFDAAHQRTAVTLPFQLESFVDAWDSVRPAMVRRQPPEFTRDEWAYVIGFLQADHLWRPYLESFGEPAHEGGRTTTRLARPRGAVAVWLPSNVSLLGPVTLILLSLTGNSLLLKEAAGGGTLTQAFLQFLRDYVAHGSLSNYLRNRVRLEVFDREDPRNREMAAEAKLRLVFGSDEAAVAVDAMPHPTDSVGFAFSDRRSEAWVEPESVDDQTLENLIKVFSIYGQAGCTSPSKLVLIGGTRKGAIELRNRLADMWPRIARAKVPMHIASSNVMAYQLAQSGDWEAVLTKGNGAVVAVGNNGLQPLNAPMALPIVATSLGEALECLPANIQTLGHAVRDSSDRRWLWVLAHSRVKRFVPLEQMHHFGPVWDGWAFWRSTFEEIEVAT